MFENIDKWHTFGVGEVSWQKNNFLFEIMKFLWVFNSFLVDNIQSNLFHRSFQWSTKKKEKKNVIVEIMNTQVVPFANIGYSLLKWAINVKEGTNNLVSLRGAHPLPFFIPNIFRPVLLSDEQGTYRFFGVRYKQSNNEIPNKLTSAKLGIHFF